MEANATETDTDTKMIVCEECGTQNVSSARFCKSCGASISPPPQCPKCGADVPKDAKFCHECGAKLVGARPSPPPQEAPPREAPPPKPGPDAPAAELPRTKPPPKPSSNIGTNVLIFVAVLAGLLVVIYVMNKDKAKEHNPMSGGPPPVAVTPPPSAPPTAAPPSANPQSQPFVGRVELGQGLNAIEGTLFIVVRNQGSPNRGPPLAVRKIDSPKFPADFTIGPGDVMMPGMPFQGPFDVYARIDQDGNAMTRAAGDLSNSTPTTGVKPGDKNVRVVLDKQL